MLRSIFIYTITSIIFWNVNFILDTNSLDIDASFNREDILNKQVEKRKGSSE